MIAAPPRLGALLAGGAALVALALSAPVQAAPGGANSGCGSYCPTGGEAGNGNGNAKHGKEAGSVGNADAKNPPGQFEDGGDANNGYECDGNKGVALGNPAHSGCDDGGYPDDWTDPQT